VNKPQGRALDQARPTTTTITTHGNRHVVAMLTVQCPQRGCPWVGSCPCHPDTASAAHNVWHAIMRQRPHAVDHHPAVTP
jgi:hypothetical protein